MNEALVASARNTRRIVERILSDRNLALPKRWVLVEAGHAWLIGTLPQLPSLEPYIKRDLIHSLSTALGGRSVIVSNSTGLRYVILMSQKPKLPKIVDYPGGELERDAFPVGMGFGGGVHPHAREWQHMLIGGDSGSGKSTLLRSLALTARRHGWQIYLADPDGHTFDPDSWDAVCSSPVAQLDDEMVGLLEKIEAELSRRLALYREQAKRTGRMPEDIDDYNQAAQQLLARAMLIVDEANSYLGDKAISKHLEELVRRGRKWGLHIVVAAHNWRASDVPKGISTMFGTRVCLRIVDHTSGEVTLESRTWGKAAAGIQTPGRAVMRLNGRLQWVQTYRVTPEQLSGLQAVETPEALSKLERELVRYAVEELEGGFIIGKLADVFGEQISHYKISKLAEQWEKRTWLTPPLDAVSPRLVTDELKKLAGISV